jgi:hypothetical protein
MCKIPHFLLIYLLVFPGSAAMAQTLGGGNTYAFLKMPAGPQLTALGSANVSVLSGDISMSAHNPALLRKEMDRQMLASFNIFQGIRQMNGMVGFHSERLQTNFSGGIDHIHYGEGVQTDAAGNILGNFRANDYAIRLAFSRRYLSRWHYGATLKYVNSTYGMYSSQAVMADVGINYLDSGRMLQVGFVAKNMGLQLTSYAGQGEDLPFDLQMGITKRLLHAPLQFSLTAHRLHQFDILYRDTVFNIDNYGNAGKDGFADKLFRHLIFSVQAFVGERVELTLGYDFLRRAELGITRSANGMTGFSMGAGVSLKRMQVRYAGSAYQNGISYHQFGLNLDLSGKK